MSHATTSLRQATCEHADSASSSTHVQLIGRGGKPGEPDRYSSDAPRPMTLEDLGLGPHHLG
jgi:hypothetical protein